MEISSLGKRLTAFRKLRGLTQENLAEMCGVSLATISRWETGSLQPKPRNLKKLAEVLETDEASFFSASETLIPENFVVKEFINLLKSLNENEQIFVLNCLRGYVEVRKDHFS